MMRANAYKYPSETIKGFVNKGLFIEMWWFECYDPKAGVEFAIMYCINNPGNGWFGRAIGLPRSADIIICAGIDGERRSKCDFFYKTFSASDTSLDVNVGDAVFIKGIDDRSLKIWGDDKSTGCSFDLVFSNDMVELPPVKTAISGRKNDNFWFYPVMPRARVTGSVSIDGKTRRVDCSGYHDHDWGSPTKVAWSPWAIIANDGVGIITYTSDGKHGNVFVLDEGKWITFPMPSVTVKERTKCRFVGKKDTPVYYDRPVKILLATEKDGMRVEYEISEGDGHAYTFDFGWALGRKAIHAPATISVNYTASGTISKGGTVVKEFYGVNTSFQWYESMDYFKLFF